MKEEVKRQKAKGRASGAARDAARRLRRAALCLFTFAFCLLCLAAPTSAQYGRPPQSSMPVGGTPEVLKTVTIEQRLGEQVPLDAVFRDESGREVRLGEYFKKGRPVLLSLVYYECPMLCNEILNSLTGTLMAMSFTTGKEFEVVTVSFDARELPPLAAAKKQTYLRRYKREGAAEGWHFLTGSQESIDSLTRAVGFNYVWDEKSEQFAHASAIMVATPEGKLSHYFYGVEYSPKDVRLAIVEASSGKVGSAVDQLVLYCYHYDPATGKYGPVVMNIMRVAGVATVVCLIGLVVVLGRRRRRGGDAAWEDEIDVGGAV
ncbi:MAG TPA: SCO family protein [Pyrinomonadaceae bacterium]|nr:SCO family protein [Pyrinomonadaceae bacterium]